MSDKLSFRKRSSSTDSSSSSNSSSSYTSSSSDSTDSDRKKRKHSKSVKKKEHKKDDKHRKEKHRHEKKDKHKHKKHKKHKSSKHERHSSHSINQNEYGKFGIIREDSYYQKVREFEAYMTDVKGNPSALSLPRREIMEHFKSYMEDFNTATMPHAKYYDYAAWETKEYQEKQLRNQKEAELARESGDIWGSRGFGVSDEEQRRIELKMLKMKQQQEEFIQLKNRLSGDHSVRSDMRRQEELQGVRSLAYKSGDSGAVERLGRVLKPDRRSRDDDNDE